MSPGSIEGVAEAEGFDDGCGVGGGREGVALDAEQLKASGGLFFGERDGGVAGSGDLEGEEEDIPDGGFGGIAGRVVGGCEGCEGLLQGELALDGGWCDGIGVGVASVGEGLCSGGRRGEERGGDEERGCEELGALLHRCALGFIAAPGGGSS